MRIVAICVFSVLLAACSTERVAEIAADFREPTGYQKQVPIFTPFGYGDRKVSERVYEVWFHGNMVTTPERTVMMTLYHAAKLGDANGFATFSMDFTKQQIECTKRRHSGQVIDVWVVIEGVATYDPSSNVKAKVFPVSETVLALEAKALTPTSSEVDEQRTYISNSRSCGTGVLIRPKDVRTLREIEGNRSM